MKKMFVLGILLNTLLAGSGFGRDADSLLLKPKAVYGREAHVITSILEDKHYRKIPFNDSLSSVILDSYLKELDNSKTYFLESDIKSFDKYRYSLDDLTRAENVNAAYEIYDVFHRRYQDRMKYVLEKLVNENFDFTADEYYETDRDHEPWPQNMTELNDLWRRNIKSQALSLKLAGKKPDEIKDTIKKRYERFMKTFSQFNSEDVFSIYMNCITGAYDPHTSYFSAKQSDAFKQQMSLSLEGIGAQLQTENDFTKVVKILPGGPAEKSNKLFVNDLITGVAQGKDGEMVDVVGWRIDEVVKLIKGPKGTTVRLNVLPAASGVNGPATELTFVRDKIKLEDQAAKKSTINYQLNGKNVKYGVITLPSFYMDFDGYQRGDPNYASTTRDVKRLIKELQGEGIEGLVIDLRNNGGGSLAEAVDLTGLFIKEGPVVQVKSSSNKIDVLPDDDRDVTYAGPLVILTNRFSASASEIFAGAIQDYQRGIIVGESTFGKGTVQSLLPLNRVMTADENVGELKLTFQKFYRITGSSTQHKGVIPDVKLPTALLPNQFGESANPSALPWDVIRSTSFQRTFDVNEKLIQALNKSYLERLKYDGSLRKYASETEELKKSMEATKVSLNETKRREEIAEAEKRKAAYEKLNTKVSREGLPANDLQKMEDEYLRESLLILADMIAKRIG